MAKANPKVKKVEAKKTTKSVTFSIADLRKLPVDELQNKLQTARADLLEARKSLAANELANPRVVRKMRREIARILTIIAETTPTRHSERSEESSESESKNEEVSNEKTEPTKSSRSSLPSTNSKATKRSTK
jgi:large subunit ribosomal protein L29